MAENKIQIVLIMGILVNSNVNFFSLMSTNID